MQQTCPIFLQDVQDVLPKLPPPVAFLFLDISWFFEEGIKKKKTTKYLNKCGNLYQSQVSWRGLQTPKEFSKDGTEESKGKKRKVDEMQQQIGSEIPCNKVFR